jgi:FkbM family methyltransferase
MRTAPEIVQRIVSERLWGESDFFLLDVGASGGVGKHWAFFGDRLRAIAFEPLLAEAERLQRAAAGSKITYEAAFATCRDYDQMFPPDLRSDRIRSKNNDPYPRTSAARAQEVMRINYPEHVFNAGAPAEYTDRRVVLDEFIPAAERPSVDFLKIDTDGHDIEVLLGAQGLVDAGGILGMSIEAQFHGASDDHANTFATIDGWMRRNGFSLFDLEIYRYSRGALPAPFKIDSPAQTLTGQVLWGEAVYFRDLAAPDYERMWSYPPTRERVFKLAALFDLFRLPDCAAELLQTYRALTGDTCDFLLDQLVAGLGRTPGVYREFIAAFDRDPTAWYPPPAAKKEPLPSTVPERAAMAAEIAQLQQQVARLKSKSADLIERLKRRDEHLPR